jgi:hypothetical protein
MHLLFLDSITNQPKNQIDEGVHRVIVLLSKIRKCASLAAKAHTRTGSLI